MSRTVDERVVEMQFDNKQFESGIKTSLKSIDNLKKGLNFDAASKSLSKLEKAGKDFSLIGIERGVDAIADRFTNLGIVGVTALQNITNAAINAGAQMLKSLTIGPVLTGFEEYETKMNAITTILTNTASKGTTLEDVNRTLNELNTYADQTIYNFAEMTRNIGTFTAAGVDLETSAKAIKGIANLAAGSGSTSAQASTAMYQLSQAIAAGRVSLQDWNSVVNAGMGGELFQNALKETAKQMGIVVDESVSFRESISATGGKQSWLTSDVLVSTLEKFAEDETLLKAATQVKTFTQLIDTMKESVQSGWAQSWEYLIGDREQAAELFTSISDGFNSIIGPSTEARNAALQFWNINGGREATIQGLTNVLKSLGNILGPIGDAFNDAFPPLTGERLVELSEKFRDLTERFKVSEQTSENIRKTFKALFDIVAFGTKGVGVLVGAFTRLIGVILPVGGGLFGITGTIGSMVSWLIDAAESLDLFSKAVKIGTTPILFLVNALVQAVNLIGDLSTFLDNKINIPSFEELKTAITYLLNFKKESSTVFTEMNSSVQKRLGPTIDALERFGNKISSAKDKIVEFAGVIKRALSPLINEIKASFKDVSLDDVLGVGGLVGIFILIKKIFKRVDEVAGNFDKIVNSFVDVLDTARESLEVWQKDIQAGTLLKIAIAVGILAASLIALTFVDPDKLQSGLIGVSVLLAEVIATMEILNKFKVSGIAGAAASMVIMAVSISILASALGKFKEFQDWDRTWPVLASIEALMLGLTASAKILSKNVNGLELIKSSFGLILFAQAIKQMADAMIKFSALDGKSIAKSLGSLGAILAGITIFIRVSKLDKLKGAKATIIEIASSMVILYAAIKLFSMMDTNELVKGLTTVAILLGALSGSLKIIGSTQMKGVSTSVLAIATALNMLMLPIRILGGMDTGILIKGLAATTAALVVISSALSYLGKTSLFSGSFVGVGVGLIALSTALNLLLPSILILGNMPWQSLVIGIGSLIVVLGALGATSYLLAPLGTSLLAVAGAFALFGVAAVGIGAGMLALSAGLAALSVSGAAGVAVLLGMITGVLAMIPVFMKELALGVVVFLETLSDMAPVLGASLTTIIIEALESLRSVIPAASDTILYILSNLLDDVVEYTPKIGQALIDILIGALDILEKNVPTIVKKVASVIKTIMASIIDLAGDFSAEDTKNILSAISILIVCYRLLALSSGMAKNALKGALGMAAVMAVLSGMLFLISLLPINDTLEIATSLSTLLVAISAAMLITSMVPIAGAVSGVAGIAIFVAGLTAVLAALGGLNQIPGFSWLIGEGGNVLGQIGNAIGSFVGGIASGALSGVSSSFPQIGKDLSGFMTNAKPFFDGLQNVNATAMEGVKALAASILVLTASDVINGLTSWFTGGSSLADFGKEIADFAPYFKKYADSIHGIDSETVVSSANAAKALAELASSLPNSGGVAGFFAGENNLSDFAKELVKFGPNFKEYANSVAGLDPNVIYNSANAAKALAELASSLPNSGGVAGFFAGENDISTFGNQLRVLGPAISAYANSVTGVDPGVIKSSAEAVSSIVELASLLPNSGGLIGSIAGNSSLGDFAYSLRALGSALSDYYSSISNIGLDVISSSSTALENTIGSFNTLANSDSTGISVFVNSIKEIPSQMKTATNSVVNAMTTMESTIRSRSDEIGSAFSNLMTNGVRAITSKGALLNESGRSVMTSFMNTINAAVLSNTMAAQANMTRLFNAMIYSAQQVTRNSHTKFQNEGQLIIQSFINGMNNRKSYATLAVSSILSSIVSKINEYDDDFYNLGYDMIQGLADGITDNRYSAINAAANVAADTLTAAKNAVDSNSPSKKFEKLGMDSDTGLANGFIKLGGLVRRSAESVTESALYGAQLTLKQLPNILSDDVALSPRIVPVLDLTNIQSGASAVNRLLPSGYSIRTNFNTSDITSVSKRLQSSRIAHQNKDYGPDILEAFDILGSRVDALGDRVAQMQVVLDTGATVGGMGQKMDQRLGQMANYKGRNI